jgi:ankyrin repeat protein
LKGYSVCNVQEEDIPGFDYFSLGNSRHYNRQNCTEQTPLMVAIIAGNTNAVNQLIAKPELNLTVSLQ